MKHFFFFSLCIFHLTFINAQNVGINKTNPQHSLDVHGAIATDSAYYLQTSPVLVTDGSDNCFVGKYAGGFVTIQGGYNTLVGSAAGGITTILKEGNVAIGRVATTNNCSYAVALGSLSNANFDNSIAIGANTTTPAANTIVLGRGITAIYAEVGLTMTSDKNKKEKFQTVNREDILQKLSNIPLSSWNLKGQDTKKFRHYGPMAQDFYAAFGKDKYGSIGNDTTINSQDAEGISLIAIQALAKRTAELKHENDMLKKQLTKVSALETENETLKKTVAQLKVSFDKQQQLINDRLAQLEQTASKQTLKETVAVK